MDAGAPEAETDALSARITDLAPGQDYVVSVWALDTFGEAGPRSTMLVEGTELRLRQPAEPMRAKALTDVSGRVLTTFDGEPVARGTVHLQRLRADGTGYRSLDVWADTGPRGRFSLSFRPKADVEYRVALVGNAWLGASAAALPVVA